VVGPLSTTRDESETNQKEATHGWGVPKRNAAEKAERHFSSTRRAQRDGSSQCE